MFFKMVTWRAMWQLCLLMSLLNIRSGLSDACNTTADCYSTQVCSNADGISKCICTPGRVWDDEYQDCVKNCSYSRNTCKDSTETCVGVGPVHKCKCTSSSMWDESVHACVKICSTDSECNSVSEYCNTMIRDMPGGGLCTCRDGHTWDTLTEQCRKESACQSDNDCQERQQCVVSGSSRTCRCRSDHFPLGKCVKPCSTRADCYSTESCYKLGSIDECFCTEGRVWDNEYQDCVKDCTFSAYKCKGSTETCVKDGNFRKCQCKSSYKWDRSVHACVKTCSGASDCDGITKYCHTNGISAPDNGHCLCRHSHTWNTEDEECKRHFSCVNNNDCPEHEVCRVYYSGVSNCFCDTDYWRNSQEQCIKSCTSDADCGMAHYVCSGVEGAKSCVCEDDRVWNNKLNACMKLCKNNGDCYPTQICDGGTGICECPAGREWDDKSKRCAKVCENPSDCDSRIEYCGGLKNRFITSKACQCSFGYTWDSQTEKCERDYSCGNIADCLEHETCDLAFSIPGRCYCDPYYRLNSLKRCRKPCTSDADCGMAHYVCSGVEGAKSCECEDDRVWNNTLNACMKLCKNNGDCYPTEICDDSTGICKCSADREWDNKSKRCAKVCENPSDCDSRTEYCDVLENRSIAIKACQCSRGYTWDSLAKKCERNFSCGNNNDCLEHEVCTNIVNGNGICACDTGYQRNSRKQCIKQSSCESDENCLERQHCDYFNRPRTCRCLSDHQTLPSGECAKQCNTHDDCYPTEICNKAGNISKCICSRRHVWDNEYQGCVKNCSRSTYICKDSAEICEEVGNLHKCKCTSSYTWDESVHACVKKCSGGSECNSITESCAINGKFSLDDGRCVCRDGHTWDTLTEQCIEEPACRTNEDCQERQECDDFGGLLSCGCPQNHQALPSGECIKQCNTKTDCYSTEICNKTGVIGKCTCAPGRVWDNEYGDCVKDCSHSQNTCKDSTETCVGVGPVHKCKCTSSYTWDEFVHACVKKCLRNPECNNVTEYCALDMERNLFNGHCECRDGYSWDTLAEKCERNFSCGNNNDCLEHEVCTNVVNGKGTCACDTAYHKNSRKQCIKSCTSNADCGATHYVCSGVEGAKSCVCEDDRVWNNKVNACIKLCNKPRDCNPMQQCHLPTGICGCFPFHEWDNKNKRCAKICENPSDCGSKTEFCDRLEDPLITAKVCQCPFGYTWDFQAEKCDRNYFCENNNGCLLHEKCTNIVDAYGKPTGTRTCACDYGYLENSLGQCIKSCTSDADCGMAHYGCIGDGGAKSCVCKDNRVWDDKVGACLKRCQSGNRCVSRFEYCIWSKTAFVCACSPFFTWDPIRDQCVN